METKQENVIATDYADVMQKSYIDYAMSVIIHGALPDVRDGLKPVQRRTCMICTSLGSVTTVHIVSAPVSLEIPWVNTTSWGQLYL